MEALVEVLVDQEDMEVLVVLGVVLQVILEALVVKMEVQDLGVLDLLEVQVLLA